MFYYKDEVNHLGSTSKALCDIEFTDWHLEFSIEVVWSEKACGDDLVIHVGDQKQKHQYLL
jgi:hypothetical protein